MAKNEVLGKSVSDLYQSMVIWLRIMNRQVAHIQTIAVTEAGTELWLDNENIHQVDFPYKPGQSQESVVSNQRGREEKEKLGLLSTKSTGIINQFM